MIMDGMADRPIKELGYKTPLETAKTPNMVKGDKVDSGRRKFGVVFGDGVKTGINSSFNPGVKVGVNSRIGSGAIIYSDVGSNKIVLPRQDHGN